MSTETVHPEVLVIDDETQIRRLLRVTLEGAGFRVREADSGQLGLAEAATKRPEAIILDLGLPDLPGLEVLKRLREWSRLPVLILSVRGQETDKIEALDAGADDYLSKPFGGGELLARLRAMLRRAQSLEEESNVRFGDVEVDFARRAVTKAGAAVKLTPKEYALLRLLLVHRGKVITHRQILRELWGPRAEEQTQYLRVYMTHLRQKLEDEPNQPKHFRTESGVGYRFTAE
ncbi:MAG: response regulator [Opitutaceae bacterium]|nr:response regulator [Opitutaceae bacterium]